MRARFRSVFLATITGGVIGIVLLPGAAWGDGDPASDVLLGQNVFYPYSPPVSASLQRTLDAVTAAAKRAGFPIKVALIASPVDLGVVPDLFGAPQKYAAFLDQEISFNVKQRVLVVMPAGFGGAGLGPAAPGLAGLPRPGGAKSDDLARAAIQAVPKLAAEAGHSFKAPGGANGSGGSAKGSGGTSAIVFAAPLLLVALAVAFMTLRSRRTREPSG